MVFYFGKITKCFFHWNERKATSWLQILGLLHRQFCNFQTLEFPILESRDPTLEIRGVGLYQNGF